MENKYDKYAVLKIEIARLEKEADSIKEEIVQDMVESGKKTLDHGLGKFTITTRKTWSYPAKLVEAEDELKAAKVKAQDTNEATYTESQSLTFKADVI